MPAQQSNLSQAVSPQTQASLLALMERQQQIELQGRSQNLQLQMQENQIDEQFESRKHDRKMQQEQMKFAQSEAGQRQIFMGEQAEKERQAQADNYAKLNASKERMEAAAQAAQEKAAKVAYRHQLEEASIRAKVAAAEGKDREKLLAQLKQGMEKYHAYAKSKASADLQHAQSLAGAEAGFAQYIRQNADATATIALHLQDAAQQAGIPLAEFFANLESPMGEADLLQAEPSSFSDRYSGFLRGGDTGYLKDKPGHPVEKGGKAGLFSAVNTILPEAWELDKVQHPASAVDPQEMMAQLTDPIAERLAPAYGIEKQTVRIALDAMFQAGQTAYSGHPKAGDETKRILNDYLKNWGDPGKMSPTVLTAIANQLGKLGDEGLKRISAKLTADQTEANQNDVDNLDADFSNRQHQQNLALKTLYTAMSNAPHVLGMAGVRMDADEQKEFMQHMADAINQASKPAEKARIARENMSQMSKLFPNTDPKAVTRFLDEQADLEKYELGDQAAQMDIRHQLEMTSTQLEALQGGTAAGSQMEYDLLRQLADQNR